MTIVGVCGYGYTGCGAVYSLIEEYEKTFVLPGNGAAEFVVPYTPDGIEDLKYHLCDNPVKGTACDAAIYRFKLMCKDLKRSHDRFTNNRFFEISDEYLNSLIQIKWKAVRQFEYERQPGNFRMYKKYLINIIRTFMGKRGIKFNGFPLVDRYLSIKPDDFVEKSKKYVMNLIGFHDEKVVLLNQPFAVNNPECSMKYFEDPYCIIVDRDPRDLYVMAKHVYGTQALFIPTDNVENFIMYFKKIREIDLEQENPRVIRIQFEDLIYKYENTVKKIENFLKNKLGEHLRYRKIFNPEFSLKNTCIFNMFEEDKDDIKKIEDSLGPWLYNFDNHASKNINDDLKEFTYL